MSERAKDRVSGASEQESGRVNKRMDEAVMNDRVLGQKVTVSEQASGPIPIKALSYATGPFGMTPTNACFVIDLKFEI